MSFSNQEYCVDPMPYNKCCKNTMPYTSFPMVHPVELEPYPAVFYTFYPPVSVNASKTNSLGRKKVIANEHFYQKGEMIYLPERDFNTSSGESSLKLSESFVSSDCSIQDYAIESEESQLHDSSISSSFNDSIENKTELTGTTDIGFFGVDGCWYPCASNSNSGTSKLEGKSDQPQIEDGARNEINIIPPARLVMPKSLMQYYNCYQRLDLPSTILGRPQLVQTFPTDGSISLQDLWTAHMKLLFRNFPHKWTINSFDESKQANPSWQNFRDLAKVRFYCQRCMDGWTSMFGVVVFFYVWNTSSSCGEIFYQVSGQKCGRCNPATFETPLWYPEEAQKVITNLYYEIAARIYGLRTPQHIRTRRLGQPVNHHNKSLCQGCTHGVCKPELKDAAQGSSFPSSLHTDVSSTEVEGAESESANSYSPGIQTLHQTPPIPISPPQTPPHETPLPCTPYQTPPPHHTPYQTPPPHHTPYQTPHPTPPYLTPYQTHQQTPHTPTLHQPLQAYWNNPILFPYHANASFSNYYPPMAFFYPNY